MFKNKIVLVTGGTGSFGKKFCEYLLKDFKPKKLIIFSRDELKQYEMQKEHFIMRNKKSAFSLAMLETNQDWKLH